MGKHSIRGVTSGIELDVRGTDSKRAKSHRKGEPRRDDSSVKSESVKIARTETDLEALWKLSQDA